MKVAGMVCSFSMFVGKIKAILFHNWYIPAKHTFHKNSDNLCQQPKR